jgi:protoheme ferro-lyase
LSTTEEKEYKVGVLFLNLGGPTTGEDVEGNVMHQLKRNTDEEVWFLK